MKQIYRELIYLIYCSINDILPNKKIVKKMDLNLIYKLSKYHSIDTIISAAIDKAGIKDNRFIEAHQKSIRKNILFDFERNQILQEFENNGIWYMPLKGCILKDLYPINGMRKMADNDILFDENKRKIVNEIMLSRGYKVRTFEKSNHDVYVKEPVLNFELHTELFSSTTSSLLNSYYKNIKKIMKKDRNNKYGYHLTDEDFYIYMTAHEWKHYNNGGIGLRSLIDCYLFLCSKKDKLDLKYIEKQTKKLGIHEFEVKRKELAIKIFSKDKIQELNDDELEMLMYYIESGTYGTYKNMIRKKLDKESKLSFLMHSIFISKEQMNASVPFTAKSPLLYPIGLIWRCCRTMLFKKDKIKVIIKEVKKYKK